MWQPRSLTTLWASTACYRDSFTFFFFAYVKSVQWPVRQMCQHNPYRIAHRRAGSWWRGPHKPVFRQLIPWAPRARGMSVTYGAKDLPADGRDPPSVRTSEASIRKLLPSVGFRVLKTLTTNSISFRGVIKKNSVALVRKRTIPTERPPLSAK
jgi:hypothetical protein